jgi:hypothetical protein
MADPIMTRDLQREFKLLRERAELQLKDVPESGSYRHVFSFWAMPSFTPAYRWTVYSTLPFAKGKRSFATCAIWRSDLDSEKLRSPVERLRYPKELAPTIQEATLWLRDGQVEEIEQRIRGISIPLYLGQTRYAGCDGTRFEFRCDELFFGTSLHWWEDLPSEWRPFTEAVMQVVTELQERRRGEVQSGGALNESRPIHSGPDSKS